MFVLSARLPRLSGLPPPARQRGTGTRSQPHFGFCGVAGRTSRFSWPRAFPVEWAGWRRTGSPRPSRVQPETPVRPPGLSLLGAPLPELLAESKRRSPLCLSCRGRTRWAARGRGAAGTPPQHRYPAAAGAAGVGGGAGLPGVGEKGAGLAGRRCWTG